MADLTQLPRFYKPDLQQGEGILDGTEAHHCLHVLRMKAGDKIVLTDGLGHLAAATIVHAGKKEVQFRTGEWIHAAGPEPGIHIAIAPTKGNDRFEWFLEKATEMGVAAITPLLCQHGERARFKPDRWEKILVAAMKQCQRDYLPELHEATTFQAFLNSKLPEQTFMAHRGSEEDVPPHLADVLNGTEEAVVMIGPEGDFSQQELALATSKNIRMVSLGSRRLRTETAGLSAVATYATLSKR
ncbi:MAG: 16S rRNA (uracil(1498)-N(3))-methyltransferase [Flavobacteriales bacterium]|nr:16S rRNA (uracil(1498)-N(3))-methyltransferase [Flavobacteriales bacterium]MCB9448079.1 16S rRNA (uracil(1498)-N(3))-methyltransferase [Flavobacteriales bacterium]